MRNRTLKGGSKGFIVVSIKIGGKYCETDEKSF